MSYRRREWLRDDNVAAVFGNMDGEGFAELIIADGEGDSIELFRFYGNRNPAEQLDNLILLTRLIDVLTEFRGAYQNAIQDTETSG